MRVARPGSGAPRENEIAWGYPASRTDSDHLTRAERNLALCRPFPATTATDEHDDGCGRRSCVYTRARARESLVGAGALLAEPGR
jgi:hypothetical protein